MVKLNPSQPVVMTVLFAISKAVTRRGPVKLSSNRADLQRAIESLRAPKEERKQRLRQDPASQITTSDKRLEDQPPHAPMAAPELPLD